MNKKDNLSLIVLDNCVDFGMKVSKNINLLRENTKEYTIRHCLSRFSNGEGKAKLEESVRDKDVYIISDVGNYSNTYMMHGFEHRISPDEHFQDIKRIISATCGHAERINLVMPLLYQARQHKRKGRESLDCAIALQELEKLGVNNIITFDAHDPNVSNAIPKLPFENVYPTNIIVEELVKKEKSAISNLLVVSPDMGAMDRARYYADILGTDVGVFYKRRDLRKLVNGKNPIIEHVYMGADVQGKNILVVDDMIASGGSMVEVAKELKSRGAGNIYLAATFALLTEGPDVFIKAYEEGLFTKLYSTNLSYVPENIKSEIWYVDVDCSMQLANIIDRLNSKTSLSDVYKVNDQILQEIERLKTK